MRWIYLLPAGLLLTGVLGVPLVFSLAGGAGALVKIPADGVLPVVAINTLAFALTSTAIELLLGLAMALILNERIPMRGAVRAAALLPWILPTAVMALSWRWIFNDTYGLANDLLQRLGILDQGIAWLGRPGTAFLALVLADVWKTTPFVALLLLAGLQSIPPELYEAMSLDGAGPLRRFLRITVPLLRPAIALALTFRVIQAVGIFDLVWVLTGGGPANATRTVALHIHDQAFRYLDPAYGAALTGVTAAACFVLAVVSARAARGGSQP